MSFLRNKANGVGPEMSFILSYTGLSHSGLELSATYYFQCGDESGLSRNYCVFIPTTNMILMIPSSQQTGALSIQYIPDNLNNQTSTNV